MSLANRRIVITGAANGIGRTTALRFLEAGARVGAIDRDAAGLARLPAGVVSAVADVTDEAAVAAAMDACAAGLGGIDGLVCGAGIDLIRDFDAMTAAEWRRVMDINLTGPMLCCQAALPHMRAAGGGTVVAIASGAALLPIRQRTAYCASKAGLMMFAKAMAIDVAKDGIRVNVVCPGAVETDMLRGGFTSNDVEAERAGVRARYAMARIAEPEEIAGVIAFLTGPDSSFMTGAALAVDGGRTFH